MTTSLYGPLYADPHAVVVPGAGFRGRCSHQAPDSCPACDGTAADAREAVRDRRRTHARTTATEATR